MTIPDSNFRSYLLGNQQINTNNDTAISLSEATAFTDTIFYSGTPILDFSGIEAFTNMEGLEYLPNGSNNTWLNISQNVNLKYLKLNNCELINNDVTQNINLTYLSISNSSLQFIDVSQCHTLSHLDLSSTALSSIDLTQKSSIKLFTD